MSGKEGLCIGGGGVAVSCVNTDVVKYLLRMSVFIVVSSCSYFAVVFKWCNIAVILPLAFL